MSDIERLEGRRKLINICLDKLEENYTPILESRSREYINSYIRDIGGDLWIGHRIHRYNKIKHG